MGRLASEAHLTCTTPLKQLSYVSCGQDNLLHGRFLAELTKEVMVDLEASKYQHAEYRISIYGRKRVEWDILAAWVVQNKLASDNVIWLIQARPPCWHACILHKHACARWSRPFTQSLKLLCAA